MRQRPFCLLVAAAFLFSSFPVQNTYAQQLLNLPEPGEMVGLSPAYRPVLLRGVTVHKDNPFLFDFIVDKGQETLGGEALKVQGERLIKYFLASLAIPEKELWVNLSPYEQGRTVPSALGQTDMGRDLLAQDYMLKQITASLIYPDSGLGKSFWDRVYARAQREYGGTQLPVNTFNKVWIMADKAEIYEHGQTAVVVGMHLKVLLEEDYLASHMGRAAEGSLGKAGRRTIPVHNIIRRLILPEIEKEVNEGRNFAALRQITHSLILASWYKNALKHALLNQVYADKQKVNGIHLDDPAVKEKIYQRYVQAYKKGVFNLIKEDNVGGVMIPRKYFSGGWDPAMAAHPRVRKQGEGVGDAAVTGWSPIVLSTAMIATKVDRAMMDEEIDRGAGVGGAGLGQLTKINGMSLPRVDSRAKGTAAAGENGPGVVPQEPEFRKDQGRIVVSNTGILNRWGAGRWQVGKLREALEYIGVRDLEIRMGEKDSSGQLRLAKNPEFIPIDDGNVVELRFNGADEEKVRAWLEDRVPGKPAGMRTSAFEPGVYDAQIEGIAGQAAQFKGKVIRLDYDPRMKTMSEMPAAMPFVQFNARENNDEGDIAIQLFKGSGEKIYRFTREGLMEALKGIYVYQKSKQAMDLFLRRIQEAINQMTPAGEKSPPVPRQRYQIFANEGRVLITDTGIVNRLAPGRWQVGKLREELEHIGVGDLVIRMGKEDSAGQLPVAENHEWVPVGDGNVVELRFNPADEGKVRAWLEDRAQDKPAVLAGRAGASEGSSARAGKGQWRPPASHVAAFDARAYDAHIDAIVFDAGQFKGQVIRLEYAPETKEMWGMPTVTPFHYFSNNRQSNGNIAIQLFKGSNEEIYHFTREGLRKALKGIYQYQKSAVAMELLLRRMQETLDDMAERYPINGSYAVNQRYYSDHAGYGFITVGRFLRDWTVEQLKTSMALYQVKGAVRISMRVAKPMQGNPQPVVWEVAPEDAKLHMYDQFGITVSPSDAVALDEWLKGMAAVAKRLPSPARMRGTTPKAIKRPAGNVGRVEGVSGRSPVGNGLAVPHPAPLPDQVVGNVAAGGVNGREAAFAGVDRASVAKGGIDLNTAGIQWRVSKDGKGVDMVVDQALLARIQREGIDGLAPVILSVRPLSDIRPLLGLNVPAAEGVWPAKI